MEDAFAIVLFVVVGVAFVAAVWALVTSRSSYDQIGSGGLITTPQETTTAERDAEIRQMLEARSAIRTARGEEAHDVDAELRALTGADDPELRDEVRQIVEAKNARRLARGEEPLDVEAEIDRRLRELGA
jgi:flagellar basal body-associated protein FliL